MKAQDIGFLAVFAVLALIKRPKLLLSAGLVCWVLAIPLFAKWVFFTAERLTWYGAAFVLTFLVISFLRPDTVK